MIYFQRGTDEVGDGVIRLKSLFVNTHQHRALYLITNPHIVSMFVCHNKERATTILKPYILTFRILFLLTII